MNIMIRKSIFGLVVAVGAVPVIGEAGETCKGTAADQVQVALADNGKPSASKDIVATAVGAGKFTTLVTAVKAAGLVETLQGDGPFTVFAPTDEAFKALPEGTLDSLLADKEKLKAVLLYHVVPGKVTAADVVKVKSAETAQGSSVKVKVDDETVMINGAKVVKADVMASNGVIHVIDKVLVPSR